MAMSFFIYFYFIKNEPLILLFVITEFYVLSTYIGNFERAPGGLMLDSQNTRGVEELKYKLIQRKNGNKYRVA